VRESARRVPVRQHHVVIGLSASTGNLSALAGLCRQSPEQDLGGGPPQDRAGYRRATVWTELAGNEQIGMPARQRGMTVVEKFRNSRRAGMGILDGKAAVVTGSGRGIGRAVAKALAANGAAVVVNDRGVSVDGKGEPATPADEVVKEIKAAGGVAVSNRLDVATVSGGEGVVDLAIKEFGKLDILVNVAGILRDRMIFNMSEEEWDEVIRVHLKG